MTRMIVLTTEILHDLVRRAAFRQLYTYGNLWKEVDDEFAEDISKYIADSVVEDSKQYEEG